MLSKIIPSSRGGVEYIIAGLGNPGPQYANTRHNAGFLCIDKLAEEENCAIDKVKFNALTARAEIDGASCLLMKPQTYMNLSGDAVIQAARFYKIPADRIIIISDDITLAPGKLRIRRSGSAGGHNGLKSLIAQLGTDVFPRVKLGVGEKPHPEYDLAQWVLGKFSPSDRQALDEAIDRAVKALRLMVKGQTDRAMSKFNG